MLILHSDVGSLRHKSTPVQGLLDKPHADGDIARWRYSLRSLPPKALLDDRDSHRPSLADVCGRRTADEGLSLVGIVSIDSYERCGSWLSWCTRPYPSRPTIERIQYMASYTN
jgi:hypothetical protein